MINDVMAKHEEEGILFRNGFLLVHADDIPPQNNPRVAQALKGFETHKVGDYHLKIAPGTRTLTVERNGVKIIVLGDVYDNEGDDPKTRVEQMATGDLIEALAHSDLGGRHAIIAFTSNDVLVAQDPFGARSVAYSIGPVRAVASHSPLLAYGLRLRRDANVAKQTKCTAYRSRKVRYLPGHISVFENVRMLPPNHVYSFRFGSIARFWPHKEMTRASEERVFSLLDEALSALRRYVSENYLPVISITGGIDARVVVAHFTQFGAPFYGVTWTDFNFDQAEDEIVRAIAGAASCTHLRIASPLRSADETLLRTAGAYNSGELASGVQASLMGATRQAILKSRETSCREPMFIIGYGGEIVRGFYQKGGRDGRQSLDPEQMARLFGTGSKAADESAEDYRAFVRRSFGQFFTESRFDRQAMKGHDPYDLFYWEHRMGMWGAAKLNVIDVAMRCLPGINSRRLFEAAISLPDDRRLSKEIFARYVMSRVPEFGKIPVV